MRWPTAGWKNWQSLAKDFEKDDIDRANEASDKGREYCAGAVSEAQRVGCESQVTEDEIPEVVLVGWLQATNPR